jgi:hypothetical protein
MTFAHFKELTDLMVKHWKNMRAIYDLGISLYDICEPQEVLVSSLWDQILTSDGLEWFNWFMYDKNYIHDGIGRADLTASDEGKPICEDLNGLYEYLVENNYFKIPIEDAKSGN